MQIKTYQSLPREAAEIRTQVFVEEQGFLREFDDIDAKALHVVIYLDGAAAATGRTFQEDNSSAVWHLGRIAVRKDYRGRGLGLAVVKALEEAAEKREAVCLSFPRRRRRGAFMKRPAIPHRVGFIRTSTARISNGKEHERRERLCPAWSRYDWRNGNSHY